MKRWLLIIIASIGIGGMILFRSFELYNTLDSLDFAQGRYDDSKLDNMGVIFEDKSDLRSWLGGYSESDDCPWSYKHLGLDFDFKNHSKVLAMAPGKVERIMIFDFEGEENAWRVVILIRFNWNILLDYGFEPWTNESEIKDEQVKRLKVEKGDWVEKGDTIATFYQHHVGSHIHFCVNKDDKPTCPKPYFSDKAYDKMMDLVYTYQPITWKLCYT